MLLTVFLVSAATAHAGEPRPSSLDGATRQGAATWLDLQMPLLEVASPAAVQRIASMPPRDRIAPSFQDPFRPSADTMRGVLTWVLPSGMRLLAASAFGSTALFGHAAWPVGGTVPAAKTSAALSMKLNDAGPAPMTLDLSVTRNWQLDAPIGGTYLDCVVRLDLSPSPLRGVAVQAPCGASGHFGVSVRSRF